MDTPSAIEVCMAVSAHPAFGLGIASRLNRLNLVRDLPMNKNQILQEIRRTALANGGTPLGSRRFATQTGIRECEWIGKLWARWGDAVREAGFAPNQPQVAYRTDELLERYAKLAQELGRLPANNDLRLKDRLDPTFPNQKVFQRLGPKADLVQQLLEYCRGRAGYEDVVRLCEGYTPPRRAAPAKKEAEGKETGFVYLIRSGRFYKIGRSKAVGRRAYELACQLPEPARTVHVIRTDDAAGIEVYWHKRFEQKRKNGEWFELAAADLAAFKRRKFM
jgi:hypothetical protein